MTNEDQVCVLELAKRMKDIGVNQESKLYWCLAVERLCDVEGDEHCPHVSAFSVGELGTLLPGQINHPDYGLIAFQTKKHGDWWECFYTNPRGVVIGGAADSEADARAKMLISAY
jgi:hypothetical protein